MVRAPATSPEGGASRPCCRAGAGAIAASSTGRWRAARDPAAIWVGTRGGGCTGGIEPTPRGGCSGLRRGAALGRRKTAGNKFCGHWTIFARISRARAPTPATGIRWGDGIKAPGQRPGTRVATSRTACGGTRSRAQSEPAAQRARAPIARALLCLLPNNRRLLSILDRQRQHTRRRH
jgi:hypothetical protein